MLMCFDVKDGVLSQGLRVLVNKMVRKIPYRPKRQKVSRELDNEKLHYLYYSPVIATVIKSKMKRAGNVVRVADV
jgi:hypothetical protein